jgi:hypothetical protein
MASLSREVALLALETPRGTAVADPTHLIPFQFTVVPTDEDDIPEEYRGTLAPNYRHLTTRQESTFSGDGAIDTAIAPVLLNMAVAPVTAPTTPTNAVLTRLWSFVPSMTADNLRSATLWWGDWDTQTGRTAYNMLESFAFSNDANSTEAATCTVSGMGQFPEILTKPALPTAVIGQMIRGRHMRVWIDTGSDAIGTTEVTGRLVSATHEITTGVTLKRHGSDPSGGLGFNQTGRNHRARMLTTTFTMELYGLEQYTLWTNKTFCKVRIRHYGNLIETESATDFYHYIEFDSYGPLTELEWGENADSNRVATFTQQSFYDADLAADFAVRIQNDRTAL